ncbi:hypothetical protein K402DRAFT_363361 [Aulographum hederae CBS 113979]|uniref:Uncharacterized protein n=1 Tax=Aulographum hederae CBS 113979 TaxID=1176131 RepID=A0A6G1GMY5_9PEZI|nr:hypothetical protein K402DRAFT_363361 [Aulographum hederae CBS 113979]
MDTPKGGATGTTTTGSATPVHHHLHVPGRRLRHFLRPDGRKVHVTTPEEVEDMRRRLSTIETEFEVVIHGTEQHINALRETHEHHEREKATLREKHGDILDEFERVIRELDALSSEIQNVSEHAVELSSNFSKYGFSSHLRTRETPTGSSANSMHGDAPEDSDSTLNDWNARRKQGGYMRFFKRPIVRQYFHKGLLWRASEALEMASYELFVDLFYVGIIAVAGDQAAEEHTGEALLRFVIVFTLGWKFWSDVSVYVSWFDADDIIRRLSVLFGLVCLLGMTTNMAASFEDTWTPLIAFYIAGRWFGSAYYLWLSYLIPMIRGTMIATAIVNFVPGLLWIGSCYVENYARQGLVWPALFLDICGSVILVFLQRGTALVSPRLKEWASKTFEFYPALNIEHKIERTGAFVTLVFGSSILSLLYQSKAEFGINAFFGKAALSLIQAFTFNWLYFEIDSFNLHTHAIRRHYASSFIWLMCHLPFVMAFTLAGSSLAHLVLAHDCEDADYHTLREPYEERSEEHVPQGLRWYYCCGLAIALMMMNLISWTHVYKTVPSQRLKKEYRLIFRFAVSIVILLLPLKHDLNSLHLVATTTCLIVLALMVELVGASCVKAGFWYQCNAKCSYSAKCNLLRKDLEQTLKKGGVIHVEDLAGKKGTEKGGYEFGA